MPRNKINPTSEKPEIKLRMQYCRKILSKSAKHIEHYEYSPRKVSMSWKLVTNPKAEDMLN